MHSEAAAAGGVVAGAISSSEATAPCAECGAPSTASCARCKGVRYCGRACQARAWAVHRLDCKELEAAARSRDLAAGMEELDRNFPEGHPDRVAAAHRLMVKLGLVAEEKEGSGAEQ